MPKLIKKLRKRKEKKSQFRKLNISATLQATMSAAVHAMGNGITYFYNGAKQVYQGITYTADSIWASPKLILMHTYGFGVLGGMSVAKMVAKNSENLSTSEKLYSMALCGTFGVMTGTFHAVHRKRKQQYLNAIQQFTLTPVSVNTFSNSFFNTIGSRYYGGKIPEVVQSAIISTASALTAKCMKFDITGKVASTMVAVTVSMLKFSIEIRRRFKDKNRLALDAFASFMLALTVNLGLLRSEFLSEESSHTPALATALAVLGALSLLSDILHLNEKFLSDDITTALKQREGRNLNQEVELAERTLDVSLIRLLFETLKEEDYLQITRLIITNCTFASEDALNYFLAKLRYSHITHIDTRGTNELMAARYGYPIIKIIEGHNLFQGLGTDRCDNACFQAILSSKALNELHIENLICEMETVVKLSKYLCDHPHLKMTLINPTFKIAPSERHKCTELLDNILSSNSLAVISNANFVSSHFNKNPVFGLTTSLWREKTETKQEAAKNNYKKHP